MVVSVTIKDEQISDIEVVEHSETEDVIGDAFSDLAAEIINSQNLNVELVSGATYSSEGFLEAVEDALNNKQKEQ
ncbi:MAG: FMN-binding protein [bacterium]